MLDSLLDAKTRAVLSRKPPNKPLRLTVVVQQLSGV
jgi:hypothetical protein